MTHASRGAVFPPPQKLRDGVHWSPYLSSASPCQFLCQDARETQPHCGDLNLMWKTQKTQNK